MDLSDGDEDCDDSEAQETNLLHIRMDHTKTSCITQEDSNTENFKKKTTQSQIVQGNIVYNNHPHLYQNYYHDYPPQVSQDETSRGMEYTVFARIKNNFYTLPLKVLKCHINFRFTEGLK